MACTTTLGVLLTVSDKEFAGFYRDRAPQIAREMKARTTGTVWSLGHWGWQWYSEQAGMAILPGPEPPHGRRYSGDPGGL
ncbi:MAG: hypothetical protein IPI95_07260 [Flavobacteriales bacterium]|nr:hypothetical protein [Flavobacteriales bacterium]